MALSILNTPLGFLMKPWQDTSFSQHKALPESLAAQEGNYCLTKCQKQSIADILKNFAVFTGKHLWWGKGLKVNLVRVFR